MTAPGDHEQKPAQGASSKACEEGQAGKAERLFRLGRTVITPAASELLWQVGILPGDLIERHVTGDFGNLTTEDAEANREAITEGLRVFSSYPTAKGKVWVITEWDRSVTTVLLPSDY